MKETKIKNTLFSINPVKHHPRRTFALKFAGILALVLLATNIFIISAHAHTPFMACFDNEDGTVTCNGEFSDGGSASGVSIRVEDEKEKIIYKGKMNEDGEYTFKIPEGKFTVVFDAGPGHVVKEKSENIIE